MYKRQLLRFSALDEKHVSEMRVSAYEISETALWEHLFAAYEQAYSEACLLYTSLAVKPDRK